MKKLTGNRVFLLVSALVLFAFSTQLSKIPQGAKEYPLVLLIVSFITVVLLFIKPQQPEETIGKENALRIFIFAILTAISIFLLTKIGYILNVVIRICRTLVSEIEKESGVLSFSNHPDPLHVLPVYPRLVGYSSHGDLVLIDTVGVAYVGKYTFGSSGCLHTGEPVV